MNSSRTIICYIIQCIIVCDELNRFNTENYYRNLSVFIGPLWCTIYYFFITDNFMKEWPPVVVSLLMWCSVPSRADLESNIGLCRVSNAHPIIRLRQWDAEPVNVRINSATAVLEPVPRCGSPVTGHRFVSCVFSSNPAFWDKCNKNWGKRGIDILFCKRILGISCKIKNICCIMAFKGSFDNFKETWRYGHALTLAPVPPESVLAVHVEINAYSVRVVSVIVLFL